MSGAADLKCLFYRSPLKSRRDEIAPVSPLSAKVALLPTTCLSSTSPQARRPPSTKPWPQWTSWWTRSSGTYSEQGTPCCSTMSCLQVESRWLTRQSGCVDGSHLSGCGFSASTFKMRFCFPALDDRFTSSSFSRKRLCLVELSMCFTAAEQCFGLIIC